MDYKFKAFISYRHVPRDTTVAKALHTTIEKYIIPRKLREKGVKRLGKVFRDEEELSASSDLSQHIRDALDAAEYLIVICSTDTLESNWVFKEITYFLEHHPKEKLLTVLTGGDSAQIYEKLLTGLPEPLSLDLRKSSDSRLARDLKALFLKLCAPLLGCEYDDLVMRDLKRRRRRILAWIAGIGIVAATIISILLWSNYQIEGKNTELEQQNNEILLRESELLTQDATDALQKEDRAAAIRYALDALCGGNDNRPYYAPAESILIQALGGIVNTPQASLVIKDTVNHTTPISDFGLSDDGERLYYTDKSGCIVCLDVATQEVLWEQKEFQGHFSFDLMVLSSADLENSLIRGDTDIIVCDSQVIVHDYFSTIIVLSAQSGEILWQHEVQMHWGDISISQDQKIAAYTAIVGKARIVEFLDLSTGEVLMSVPIRDDAYWTAAGELPTWLFKGHGSAILTKGALSEDAVLFAGSFVEKYQDGSTALCYYVANRLKGSCDLICRQKISVSSEAYGAAVSFADQDQCLIVVHLDGDPDYTFTVDKIRLTDNTMLWSTRSRDEYKNIMHDGTFQDETTTYIELDLIQSLKNDRHVVVYCGEQLYVLDSETGNIIFAEFPPEEIIKLQWLNESSFGAIMKDGKVLKYRIGADAVKATIPSALISPTYQTDISHDGSGLFYEDMYTQLQGNGAIASLPQNDGYFIELYLWNEKTFRPSNINTLATLAGNNGFAYVNSYSAYIDDTTLMLGSAPVPREDFEIGDTYNTYYGKHRFILIDTEEQKLKKYLDIPFVTDSYCWHPNHKFILQYDASGNLICVEAETGVAYMLSSAYTHIEDEAGETKYISNGYQMDVDIRNADGVLNVVRSEAKGFTYWNFAEDQSSYEFFFEYYSPLDDSVKSKARVGKNGFLGVLNKRENATRSSEFTIIDTMDNRAYYGSFEGDHCCHDFWLADHSDLLVTSHEDNSLTVFKITEQKILHQISLPFPYHQIASIQFIMDEQFLLIQGIDGQVNICNIESGVFVYQEWDGKVIALSEIHYAEDPVNQRLYVRKVNYRDMMTSGSCIDTRTWTKIADIPGFVTYDVKTDTIYRWCMDMSGAISLYASNLPGTAELISIAKELFQ